MSLQMAMKTKSEMMRRLRAERRARGECVGCGRRGGSCGRCRGRHAEGERRRREREREKSRNYVLPSHRTVTSSKK